MRLLVFAFFSSVAARCMWRRPTTCNEHFSEGPEDADLEVRLGGLPPSDSSGSVHLQWHAARKSSTEYNPLQSLVNASVYSHRNLAYPSYEDADFNGGNVRVSETGEASVRVRAPAAYLEWIFLAFPHIHLRLCYQANSSNSDSQNSGDADGGGHSRAREVARIQWMRPRLELDGRQVVALPHSDSIVVLNATLYAGRNASAAPTESSEVFPPRWIIASIRYEDDTTTTEGATVTMASSSTTQEVSTTQVSSTAASTSTMAPATTEESTTEASTTQESTTVAPTTQASTTEASTTTQATTTTEESTTEAPTTQAPIMTEMSTTVVSTTSMAKWLQMVDVHRERMDLDALEFSPVYNCLLDKQLYDIEEDDCTAGCPEGKVHAHGQCVRGETADPAADYSASWRLSMECGQACWEEGKNVTLHKLRLFFAGQLTIPFQEVKVGMSVVVWAGRRLGEFRDYTMSMQVRSNRVTTEECEGLVVVNAALLSDALGLAVRSVVASSAAQGDADVMNQDNDPYTPAYDELEKQVAPRVGATATSPLSFLPPEAIIGMAAGVVVLAIIVGALLVRRRRRLRKLQEEANSNAKADAKVKVVTKVSEFEFDPEDKNDVEVPASLGTEVKVPITASL